MAQVLSHLQIPNHPDLLVGAETGDDAAVWRLDETRALVTTVDFITPIVDDPYIWGQIAATNAASDIYAMGGSPIFALNIIGWNTDELPLEMMSQVLNGAAKAGQAGGWITIGGHTVEDPEPKFGLVVVGEVDPGAMLKNNALAEGNVLILTKPLGIGIIATAIKKGNPSAQVVNRAIESMTKLNNQAAKAGVQAGAKAATDVTGFGLLGHLKKMVEASNVNVELDVANIPVLQGVGQLASQGFIPSGSKRNLAWVKNSIETNDTDPLSQLLLADAQTSGGLLIAVDATKAQSVIDQLNSNGHQSAVVGKVSPGIGKISLRGNLKLL